MLHLPATPTRHVPHLPATPTRHVPHLPATPTIHVPLYFHSHSSSTYHSHSSSTCHSHFHLLATPTHHLLATPTHHLLATLTFIYLPLSLSSTFHSHSSSTCHSHFHLLATPTHHLLATPTHHLLVTLTSHIHAHIEDYCKFSWDAEALPPQLPLPPARTAKLRISAHAYIPHCFRLINDFSTGIVSSTIVADSRRMIEVPDSAAGDLVCKGSPRSITPTLTSYDERRRERTDGSVDKTEHPRSSLMDSLNLDRPTLPLRTSSGTNERPSSLYRAPPPDSSLKGTHSVTPSKKARNRVADGGRRDISGWNYGDIEFGLDKRASIRSDPGERGEHGERGGKSRFAYLKSLGKGSAHTSPTSSITTLAVVSDSSHPISIPNAMGMDESDLALRGNPVLKADAHSVRSGGLARNASFQSRTSKTSTSSLTRGGHSNIDKGDISAPTGPVVKDAVQPVIRKVKVEGKFSFEYSGGVGDGYYREVTSSVSIMVKPCLLFEQFDVTNCTK